MLNKDNHEHNYQINKFKPGTIIILGFIILFLFFVAHDWIPSDDEKIAHELTRRGYDVADITFTKKEKLSNVYKSSHPIQLDRNVTCEYWAVEIFGTSGFVTYVVPYPDGEWPKPKKITINFDAADYQRIEEKAGNKSVEKYIKDIIIKNVDGLQAE